MKRLSLLLMSVVLLFGMTQCKKKVEPIAGETVHITLDVDSGGKHEVYPSTGAVVYTAGDVIYVGNGGKYVGSLTYANGAFSGTLTGVVTTYYLHFYFVSGLTPSDTPSAGSTTSFTVNISDQSSALTVLSYGKSNIMYTSGTTAYTSVLENKCGLVKFVLSTATSSAVTVSGMKNVATVSFASPGITATGATGNVTLYSESTTAKWAILLPQDAVASPTVSIDGYSCSAVTIPAVTNNMYYTDGVSIINTPTITVTTTTVINIRPTIATAGGNVASVGVINARGICWGTSENPTIEIHDGMYSEIFGEGENGTGTFSQSMTGLTSGNTYHVRAYASGVIGTVYGEDLSFTTPANLIGGLFTVDENGTQVYFGSGDVEHVDGEYSFASTQWTDYSGDGTGGKYYFNLTQANSAITSLNSTSTRTWRILSQNEWLYLLNTRTTVTGTAGQNHNWKWVTVSDLNQTNTSTPMKGAIVFPDGYGSTAVAAVTSPITSTQLATLQDAGCVFLPAAGFSNNGNVDWIGRGCRYLTATSGVGQDITETYANSFNTAFSSYYFSLRLVLTVE